MENSFIEESQSQKSRNASSYLFLWIFLAIIVFAVGIYLFRTSTKGVDKINAKVHKNEFYLNEDLIYADNTSGAEKWLWEFGNGEKSDKRQGSYRFHKSGSYVIRLTVNDNLREDIIVIVKDTVALMPLDTTLYISGTTHALANEEIRLEVNGTGDAFEWWFGETNRVDAVGRSALYTYQTPGEYKVRVRSDKNPVEVVHTIRIVGDNPIIAKPTGLPRGPAEALNDLKKRIQAIADGKEFAYYYNSILSKHLCNSEKVKVQVEMDGQNKLMDIYAYLIGLTFSKGLRINDIVISSVDNEGDVTECPNLIIVKQSK